MRSIIAIILFVTLSLAQYAEAPVKAAPAPQPKTVEAPAAANQVCGTTGGAPEEECKQFGFAALSKDDFNQKTASRSAALTLVKAGTCFTLYHCATAGTALASADGKDISHVTYCGDYAATCKPAAVAQPVVEQPAPKVETVVEQPAPKVETVVEQPAPKPAEKPAEAKPAVTATYEKPAVDQEAKKEEAKKVEAPKAEAPKAEAPKVEAPKVVERPVVPIVDVPCDHTTPDAELPRVIYIAAEEEDCTSALKAEVADLQLLVDKLTVLLTLKGVKIGTGEECTVPGVPGDNGGNTPGDKKDTTTGDKTGDNKNGGTGTGTTPGDKKGGENGGNGGNPDDKKGDDNKGGNPNDKKGDNNGGKGNNPGDKKGENNGGNGGNPNDKTGENKNGEAGKQGGEGGNPGTGTQGGAGGNGKNPTQRLSTTGSSAAVNTMLTVGLVIGAAVAAGVAAVAIGLFASAAAASAPAVASAAPMASCAVNPLYTPLTQGGLNPMHGGH